MVATHSDGRKSTQGSDFSVSVPKEKVRELTTWPEMLKAWPKTTLCIVSNEFCERFSYYGMRTVLILYLLNVLKFSDDTSTIFFNGFTVLCYLTPLGGSIVADGYIGKFWTITIVSILYAIGQVVLAVASVYNFSSPVHPWMDMAGLFIIGVGTGGIKPCVSAFGGDQFDQGQERMLSLFFSMFYFSINAGSMISTFISPLFRSAPCLGQDSCYPLSFGIPAVLMIVATVLFVSGSFWYKRPPPKGNIFAEVFFLMKHAVGQKISGNVSRDHWLEHALDDHKCENEPKCMALKKEKRRRDACAKKRFIEDVKSLLRLLIMFLPVPMFWALYDQQGSVWLIQGIQMDCRLWGDVLFLPDQVQTLNAVLILAFIPLFQVVIYPIFSKCFELTPLRKMIAGGLLASLSFLITGFVQLQVNTTLPTLPDAGHSYVSFMNQFSNCAMNITPATDATSMYYLPANSSMSDNKDKGTSTFHIHSGSYTWNIVYSNCSAAELGNAPATFTSSFGSENVYYVAVSKMGAFVGKTETDKPTQGTGEFSLGITLALDNEYQGNLALCRKDTKGTSKEHPCDPTKPSDFYFWETDYNDHTNDIDSIVPYSNNAKNQTATLYVYKPVKPGSWELFYMYNRAKDVDHSTLSKTQVNVTATGVEMIVNLQGGVYVLSLTGDGQNGTALKHIYQVVMDNKVNILWQVPQIVVITAAEILFSITGYEFAYSQSAPSMKALVQAIWLLTTAVGDSIIVAITAANLFDNMATEFFAYAGAMTGVIVIFALMSIFYYEYNYFTADEEEEPADEDWEDDDDDKAFEKHELKGYDNVPFTDEFVIERL